MIDELIASDLRGRGGACFPTGPQGVLRPEPRAAPEAALPRRQRRRVGAGQLQGPRDHGAGPAPLHRGLPDHRARDRVEARLRLHPRRVHRRVRGAAARARGAARAPELLGDVDDRRAPRRRRLHLRRGDGAARVARGQARPAADEAAVPGRSQGLVRLADRRSTTSRRSRPSRRSSRWAPPSTRSSASENSPARVCSRSPETS